MHRNINVEAAQNSLGKFHQNDFSMHFDNGALSSLMPAEIILIVDEFENYSNSLHGTIHINLKAIKKMLMLRKGVPKESKRYLINFKR